MHGKLKRNWKAAIFLGLEHDGAQTKTELKKKLDVYNNTPHSSLNGKSPSEVWYGCSNDLWWGLYCFQQGWQAEKPAGPISTDCPKYNIDDTVHTLRHRPDTIKTGKMQLSGQPFVVTDRRLADNELGKFWEYKIRHLGSKQVVPNWYNENMLHPPMKDKQHIPQEVLPPPLAIAPAQLPIKTTTSSCTTTTTKNTEEEYWNIDL